MREGKERRIEQRLKSCALFLSTCHERHIAAQHLDLLLQLRQQSGGSHLALLLDSQLVADRLVQLGEVNLLLSLRSRAYDLALLLLDALLRLLLRINSSHHTHRTCLESLHQTAEFEDHLLLLLQAFLHL